MGANLWNDTVDGSKLMEVEVNLKLIGSFNTLFFFLNASHQCIVMRLDDCIQ